LAKEFSPECFRILPKIHDGCDDYPFGLDLVKDAVGIISDQHSAISLAVNRGDLRMLSQKRERRVQMAHEHFTATWLEILVAIEAA